MEEEASEQFNLADIVTHSPSADPDETFESKLDEMMTEPASPEEEAFVAFNEGFEPEEEAVEETEELEAAPEQEEESPSEEVDAQPQENLGKRATKRVQQAVNEKNDALSRLAEVMQQNAALQQQIAQQNQLFMQQQQADREAAQRQYQARLDAMRQQEMQEAYENMSPTEQFEYDLQQKFAAQQQKAIQEALKPYQEALEAQKAEAQKAAEEAERNKRFAQYEAELQEVRQEALFAGMDSKELEHLSDSFDEMVMAFSAGYGLTPIQAKPHVKKIFDDYYRARVKAQATRQGVPVKQAKKVSRAPVPSKANATQRKTSAKPGESLDMMFDRLAGDMLSDFKL